MSHWFDDARFGMFVHWGHASQRGSELSWPLAGGIPDLLPHSADGVSVADYHATAATFCPDPGAPAQWAAAAVDAGMGYAVLTARHHDGFALWPSEHTDWSIARTPYGGDLVGEYAEASRAAGLRVGLYLSLSDWHHPDYPALTDGDRPYPKFLARRSSPEAWDRYLDALFGQVRELLTGYGPIDVLWFDGQWERSAEEWRARELLAMIKSLQPDCLVTDRLPGASDVTTPEQAVPARPPEGRWETCLTMNRSWGWVPGDTDYKSARALVHTLCETAGRGGNLLLNVSPDGTGAIPAAQAERLAAVGGWMARHCAAVRRTTPGLEPWQFYGPTTRAGNCTYLFLLARPYETVSVRGVPVPDVRGVRHVATGEDLPFERVRTAEATITGDPLGELVITVPEELLDPFATVLSVET